MMPTNKVIKGRCAECGRHVTMKARGLCAPCYLRPDVRDRHAAMAREVAGSIGGKKRQAAWRASAGAMVGEYMPKRVYAIVRSILSPICGRLPVLVAWFPKLREAKRYAKTQCRAFRVRVERWESAGINGVRRLVTRPVCVMRKAVG